MGLEVDTNSWINVEDATTYFSTRYGASDYWGNSIPSTVNKEAALVTAYKQLVGCALFEFPSSITEVIKEAQCEQALYVIVHQSDADRRLGLQVQGVKTAGIVKENYKENAGDEIPISPIAKRMLDVAGCFTRKKSTYVVDIDRDEDENVDYNAT